MKQLLKSLRLSHRSLTEDDMALLLRDADFGQITEAAILGKCSPDQLSRLMKRGEEVRNYERNI